ncbi:hypothetical protein MPSEU_001012800 [Mayamaea pseudoterrestris]|nr:hypothetical protein MPSEU_001012800 [Mayamaea pseudoterrestris]
MTLALATSAGGGRSVARPVANLGNTCFANAVLQALAHAPELCLAIDCRPHSLTCPVAIENSAKMRASPSASPTGEDSSRGTRKSRRSAAAADRNESNQEELEFCALCSFEQHVQMVHDSMQPRDKPVAPEAFVRGFVTHVAPWMRIGIQEDSHEYLRLLIDAMQKSCLNARQDKENTKNTVANVSSEPSANGSASLDDKEYPFSLFRGRVESNVTCESCKASSSTIDPFEDIGLEVTSSAQGVNDHYPSPQLSDVQSAFTRFARAEALDSNYKCEKCGKVGKATKQSRLKSIPPILTLHLKRFRYGDSRNGADAMARRSGRSEVKSGSAKIEGHVKFDVLFDLRPYLTQEMQDSHKSGVVCRLFAVVVHSGKNSNSGHYIAYVRSLESKKNEWWKMDDGRVHQVHLNEVLEAEAYMLFYRVVQHPVTLELEEAFRTLQSRAKFEKATGEAIVVDEDEPVVTEPQVVVETLSKRNGTAKRKLRSFKNGEEWARSKKRLPPQAIQVIHQIQELIANDVQITPEYFRILSDAVLVDGPQELNGVKSATDGELTSHLPLVVANISENDIVGGADLFRRKTWSMLRLISAYHGTNGLPWSLSDEEDADPISPLNADELVQTALPTTSSAKSNNAALVTVVEDEQANLL